MAPPHDSAEAWEPEVTYVVGHQRPDTDAIASALGYGWFLQQNGEARVTPARAGHLAAQTQFALRRFEVEPPRLLTTVAPCFRHAASPQEAVPADAPLSRALAELAGGGRVVPVVDAADRPMGAVTPMALARAYTAGDTALAAPCGEAAEKVPTFFGRERISDHRGALLRSESDDFLVTDGEGRYFGMATRGRILEPPRARLVLVDHNELGQAVSGAEEAEITAVLDHHRLGNPPTAAPIPFVVEPVGSTSTLVAEGCREWGWEPPRGLAGMLLSGLLSDTLVLRSPTTTPRDQDIAAWLASLAGVDFQQYGEELLRSAPGLADRSPDEILDADRKSYRMGGKALSIAQAEVTGFRDLPDCRADLLEGLDRLRGREGLALACLMVTDVMSGRSRLLCRGETPILASLPFPRVGDGEWDLGGMVSRKKELIPALHEIFSGLE